MKTCVFIRLPVVLQTVSLVPPHQCIIGIREALLAEFYQVWKVSASVGRTAALLVVAGALGKAAAVVSHASVRLSVVSMRISVSLYQGIKIACMQMQKGKNRLFAGLKIGSTCLYLSGCGFYFWPVLYEKHPHG